MRVDTIFAGGSFLLGDGGPPVTQLAVLDSLVVAVGEEDCDGLTCRSRIDLGGRWVVPGFHDAHSHMAWYGLSLDDLDLSCPPLQTVGDVYALVERTAGSCPPGSWIKGSGYDENKLRGGHPQLEVLDRIAADHYVWLRHRSGHMAVVNSRVLDRLDLDAVPPGGDIVQGADGRPTGLIREQAQLLLQPLVYPVPTSDLVRAIGRASTALLAEGITSVQEAGVGHGLMGRSPVEIGAYQSARATGDLRLRVSLMVALEELHDLGLDAGPEGFGLDLGLRTGFGDDWVRIGPVKVFADGSLIGRTAAMSEPYEGDGENYGYFQLEVPLLREAISKAHRAGWQIATHAIGDRAISEVLDAYAGALREHPRDDHRHRIEHCGVIPPADIARLAELSVIPVPQGRFIYELGDGMRAALGEGRIDWCYRQKSFLDAGIPLPGSSDRPVVSGAPLLGMADLVRRRTASGVILAPSERITPEQALRAYTWGSAYAGFRDTRVGSLIPGRLADFAVLSDDPRIQLAQAEPAIDVLATFVGGAAAHDPHGMAT